MRWLDSLPGWLLPTVTLVALMALWELIVRLAAVPAFILPAPSRVAVAMVEWSARLPEHVGVTVYETLAGFALSIAVGVPVAVMIVSSRLLSRTIYPILLVLQSVPKVAVAPLLLIWVGYGELPKILVVFLVCFFPIVIGTAAGLNAAPAEMLELVRSLSASRAQIMMKVRFPYAMPQVFVGLKVAITLAVIGAVIGEFVGAEKGLGFLIMVSSSQVNTALAFAAMLLLALTSIALFYLVEWLERLVIPWAQERP
jgi:NitT/TauT family transport system permease protein